MKLSYCTREETKVQKQSHHIDYYALYFLSYELLYTFLKKANLPKMLSLCCSAILMSLYEFNHKLTLSIGFKAT